MDLLRPGAAGLTEQKALAVLGTLGCGVGSKEEGLGVKKYWGLSQRGNVSPNLPFLTKTSRQRSLKTQPKEPRNEGAKLRVQKCDLSEITGPRLSPRPVWGGQLPPWGLQGRALQLLAVGPEKSHAGFCPLGGTSDASTP